MTYQAIKSQREVQQIDSQNTKINVDSIVESSNSREKPLLNVTSKDDSASNWYTLT